MLERCCGSHASGRRRRISSPTFWINCPPTPDCNRAPGASSGSAPSFGHRSASVAGGAHFGEAPHHVGDLLLLEVLQPAVDNVVFDRLQHHHVAAHAHSQKLHMLKREVAEIDKITRTCPHQPPAATEWLDASHRMRALLRWERTKC
eukprot:3690452-Rhodomonas_salina.2